jgi:23S rRNA (cytosine1962-C5)-methyltransferase
MTTGILAELARFSRPLNKPAAVHVNRNAAANIRRGCSWVFANDVERIGRDAEPGDMAAVYHDRKLVAVGLYDPGSPIVVRVLSREGVTPDAAFFEERAQAAIARRAEVASGRTNGYRVINGPHDLYPDLVADRYADTLSVKVYAACVLPHLQAALQPLVDTLAPDRVVIRTSRNIETLVFGSNAGPSPALVLGRQSLAPVEFLENGIRFEADPVAGQKTGFFLDQRENRARVEQLHGRRVLNVFSYNGGFSLYAARGGASEVTSIDLSRPAIAAANANFVRNRDDAAIASCTHTGIAEDAFVAMERLSRAGERYDVVVVDPPSFAKQRSEVEGALRAYARLARLAARLIADGGTLVLASCSSRVSADEFIATVSRAVAEAGVRVIEIERTQHAVDHPTRFAEGEYLKCVYLRA